MTQELEPQSVKVALADSKWKQAMQEEFNALQKNKIQVLVPKELAGKIIRNNGYLKLNTTLMEVFQSTR